jgi:small subunit ribosomal protein S1
MSSKRYHAESKSDFSTKENFADLFNIAVKEQKTENTVVMGAVINIDKDFVAIDVGMKMEGLIPVSEFGMELNTLKAGDLVEVYIEKFEGRSGKSIISRRRALEERVWVTLEEALDKSETVDGVIFGKVKGGFTVDLNGVVAFLPGSQVDIRPIKDITPLMGISQPFQIFKIDRKQGNIVVSRRAILEETRNEARNEMLSQIQEGQILEGVVKNITDYGAFIDLGSIDGLLHVTDISWSRINHPSEILAIGQTVKVQVIKYNQETKRVSLGMKQLEENPWSDIEARYPRGSKVKGKVTNVADYGAFIEIGEGVEGLVHVSEITWAKNNPNPKKILNVGQEVECVVLDIDPNKHRVSLGIKQCEENPWAEFASKYKIGDIVKGEIKNIVDFGMFIGLEGDIDGMIHVSDLSWDADGEERLKSYNKGDEVSAVILLVDVEKERISLGVKQLDKDHFGEIFNDFKKGDVVTCLVSSVSDDEIEVLVKDTLTCIIKRNELSMDKSEQRSERFAVGEKVDAKILSVDKASRKVALSIKALEFDEHKKAIAEYGSVDSGASLGDILGAVINQAAENKKNKKDDK